MKVYVCWVATDCMEYEGELHKVNVTIKLTQSEANEWIDITNALRDYLDNIAYSFGGENKYTQKMIDMFGKERYQANSGKGEHGDKEIWQYHKFLYKEDSEKRLKTLRDKGYGRVAEALNGDHGAQWLSKCGYDEFEIPSFEVTLPVKE